MAVNDSAVILPSTGFIYVAAPGTAVPTNYKDPASAGFTNLGHSSREEGLTITREGGDTEVVGTWQSPSLRERTEPTTFAITFRLHQVTDRTLQLYFGAQDANSDTDPQSFEVPEGAPGKIEKALFVSFVDGSDEVGLYVPKVSMGAEDDVEVDVEGLLAFPVRATVLQQSGSNLMTFFSPHMDQIP